MGCVWRGVAAAAVERRKRNVREDRRSEDWICVAEPVAEDVGGGGARRRRAGGGGGGGGKKN
jgi:hypothetical protein